MSQIALICPKCGAVFLVYNLLVDQDFLNLGTPWCQTCLCDDIERWKKFDKGKGS